MPKADRIFDEIDHQSFPQTALQIIAEQGANRRALGRVGLHLADFAYGLTMSAKTRREEALSEESDGTFELFLKRLTMSGDPYAKGLAYDTWSVFSPTIERVEVTLNRQAPRVIAAGQSIEILPGEVVSLKPLNDSVEICCLFGIARRFLPPARSL